ncbi:MAG: BspA family leucine-rich repeat surface protein [Bacteroidales bacterium]|nr:BspA family leucine-rich repeat surface protein [Bacteroidales bacterium]
MKKNYILCILLTGIVLMTSCKKDQDFVTLRAVIDQPSKVYINSDRYPYWNEGDKVYVNNNSYVLQNISSTTAEIPNVASTANGFRAIYPSNLVAQGTNIGESTTVPVTLGNQTYRTFEDVNNSNAITQKVELPMGAYTDDDILVFHNLCSVIRLNLTNSYSSSSSSEGLTINKITITAASAFLSGDGTATINNDEDNDKIVISSGKHDVSLYCGVSLARNEQRTFDIFVPEFSSDNINVTVETTDGYIEATANGVNLGHNKIVTLTKSIESLIPYPATLLPGQDFNARAAVAAGALSNIQHVVFEYGSSTTSQYEFQTSNSQTPIYGTYNAGTLTLSTSADKIRANRNCQQMFKNFTSLMETPNFDGFTSAKTSSGNYGDHFIAEGIASMYQMFMGCTSLTSFNLGVFANTYALKNMGEMFSGCTHLTGVTNTGFSGNSTFTTENVTTMHHLFNGCTSLVSISSLSSFNTGKVGEMNAMFYNCSALQSIDLSTFNTGKVTNMECMFYGCSNTNLTSLDLSSFNTESVSGDQSMKGMFQNCSNLTTITLPSNTNIKRVANMQSMFDGCSNLATINNFAAFFNNEENGTNNVLYTTQYMFKNCSSLTVIEFPSTFKTNNVISMYGMFLGCNNLSTLDISNFTTSRTDKNINMSSMFNGCNSLGSIAFNTNFTGGKVTNMNGMFRECHNLTNLNLNNFNTTYVTDMMYMFYNCYSLSSITMGTGYSVAASNLLFGKMFYKIGIGNSPQACTITCPTNVKTFFENDRGNTNNASTPSYVVFEPLSTK